MQLFCQIQMFLVLFFSILIKAQSAETAEDFGGAEDRGADSAYVTEKMLIISTVMPILAAFLQVYLVVLEPLWAIWRAGKHAKNDPGELGKGSGAEVKARLGQAGEAGEEGAVAPEDQGCQPHDGRGRAEPGRGG